MLDYMSLSRLHSGGREAYLTLSLQQLQMVYLVRTHLRRLYCNPSRSWNSFWSHHLFPCVSQNLASTDASQPSTWKLLYVAMKGALDQSVFSSPPLVAQSSAFQRLEYIFMGWLNGNFTPKSLQFLNTLMGTSSTKNLRVKKKTIKIHIYLLPMLPCPRDDELIFFLVSKRTRVKRESGFKLMFFESYVDINV